MLTPTILDIPAEVCRVEMDDGLVVFENDKLVTYDYPLWFEVEPKLESTAGSWRRAISPFNRKFLFWVAVGEKPGVGVKPSALRLWPYY